MPAKMEVLDVRLLLKVKLGSFGHQKWRSYTPGPLLPYFPTCSPPHLLASLDDKEQTEAREDSIVEKVNGIGRKKGSLLKRKGFLVESVSKLTATAKRLPSIKPQLEQMKVDRDMVGNDIAAADAESAKAKDDLKEVRAKIKAQEKEEASLRDLIAKLGANNVTEEPLSESKPEVARDEDMQLREVFNLMDRGGEGAVIKRDFIKSLMHEKVATFLQLPGKIRQEDGTRDLMEAKCQKIAKGADEIGLEDFRLAMEAEKA